MKPMFSPDRLIASAAASKIGAIVLPATWRTKRVAPHNGNASQVMIMRRTMSTPRSIELDQSSVELANFLVEIKSSKA
jgi:hypothetical protein